MTEVERLTSPYARRVPVRDINLVAYPLDVMVAGEPGRRRDELVRALAGGPLLRLRTPGPGRPGVVVLRSDRPARDVPAHTAAPVLVVTARDEPEEVVGTLLAGATSYLIDGQFTATELLGAVLGTAAGRSFLSPAALAALVHALQQPARGGAPAELAGALSRRERQIMELVADGHPNSFIARREYIVEKTVRNHLNSIYAKLGVRSRAGAILVWWGRPRPVPGPTAADC